MSKTIVVDSSVSLRFILKEQLDIASIERLFNDCGTRKVTTIAPTLWLYEMLNGLKMAVVRSRIGKITAKKKIPDILETAPELFEITPFVEDTFSLALHYQLSVYDAAYVTLAKQKRCKFYTGDTKLYEKVKGRLKFVKPISDY